MSAEAFSGPSLCPVKSLIDSDMRLDWPNFILRFGNDENGLQNVCHDEQRVQRLLV